jgi:hypothetical protein
MDSTNSKDNGNKISDAELNKLKLELEKKGEEQTKELLMSNMINDSNKMLESVTKIMKEGEKEFVEKTGRYMTYSEIREMYG